jgi:hypothetical protein
LKKFGVLAGLAFVALLLGMTGTAIRSDEAQARPTDVLSINPSICVSLTVSEIGDLTAADLNLDTVSDEVDDALFACTPIVAGAGLWVPANLAAVADALNGDVDDPETYADLAAAGADQLMENTGALWILAFVTNDDNVLFDADEGVFAMAGDSSLDCMVDIGDEDCDENGTTDDGVVVDWLDTAVDRGDYELVVHQDGVDDFLDYSVVGEPDDIEVIALESTIMEGMDAGDCAALDLTDFTDEVEAPQVGGVLATVTDDDGVELAGVGVDWASDDTDVANVNYDATITLAGSAGIVAANLVCGDETGTAEITGDITVDDDSVEITVVGEPADMTLTASPAAIACDGSASSTVTAALVDSDGNPVVAGVAVRFEVVALGTADPINTTTDVDGVASSTITPLSGVSAGVVVLVTVPDFDLESSIRIDCTPPEPTVAPPPPATVPPPTIAPPPTGDGGYLD